MNHSSDKCQPALIHALTPVNPFHPPQKGLQPARTRPPRPRARPSPATRLPSCAQNFLPNLTQSLVNSRLTLLHLYVPFTFQRIGQRIRLRFARFSCTKTAICAGAVNHPHHINAHESQFKQMSTSPRTCPSACATPPSAAKGPPARPVLARPARDARGLRQPPVCRVAPKISCPISRKLP